MDLINKISDTVSGGVLSVSMKMAKEEIKKHTGRDITVEQDGIPDNWLEWVSKTGVNSLCTEDTWSFVQDKSEGNKRKVDGWEERAIDKIVLKVNDKAEEDDRWIVAMPEWETGSKTLTLTFYPRAKNHAGTASWGDPTGNKKWWLLGDEIVFGLQLYQLPGKCFYKSDWLESFEDYDPDSPVPNMTKKCKRWFQFRHWIMYWYGKNQWGWNWAWGKPPKNPDGTDFSLDNVLSCPSMPDFDMPSVSLPSLPGIPDMPDISMPSVSMPSISAPSAPDMSNVSMPSVPDRKMRPKNKWAAHGMIELKDLCVMADGKSVIFSNAKVTDFLEVNGKIDSEVKENQRYELDCINEEQAKSWEETLAASGCEIKDVKPIPKGCCTVA